mgnify:CR=1 FL=1
MNLFTSPPPAPSNQYYTHLITFELEEHNRFCPLMVDLILSESSACMRSFEHNGYDRGISFHETQSDRPMVVRVEYWLHSLGLNSGFTPSGSWPWETTERSLNCRGPIDRPYISRGISRQLPAPDLEDSQTCMKHHRMSSKAGILRSPGSGRTKGAKDKKPRKRRGE